MSTHNMYISSDAEPRNAEYGDQPSGHGGTDADPDWFVLPAVRVTHTVLQVSCDICYMIASRNHQSL